MIEFAAAIVSPASLETVPAVAPLSADVASRATIETVPGDSAAWKGELVTPAGFATVVETD